MHFLQQYHLISMRLGRSRNRDEKHQDQDRDHQKLVLIRVKTLTSLQLYATISSRLRSPERTDFKLAELVYRCLHGLAPQYLSDYIQLVVDSNRRRLRSSSSLQLVIGHTWLSTLGDRAFPVTESRLWNSLPPDVTSAPMLTVFSEPPQNLSLSRSFP